MKLHPQKVGLTLGIMAALLHLVWSLIVALGWGQAWVDFVTWAHMVHATYVVGPFDAAASLIVIVLAFAIGYAVGFVFANVWNKVKH